MGHVAGLVIPEEDKVEGAFYVHLPEEYVLPANVVALTDHHIDKLINVGGDGLDHTMLQLLPGHEEY